MPPRLLTFERAAACADRSKPAAQLVNAVSRSRLEHCRAWSASDPQPGPIGYGYTVLLQRASDNHHARRRQGRAPHAGVPIQVVDHLVGHARIALELVGLASRYLEHAPFLFRDRGLQRLDLGLDDSSALGSHLVRLVAVRMDVRAAVRMIDPAC